VDIEHLALNVNNPVAMAAWYTAHLGMRVVRNLAEEPDTHFLADQSGRVVASSSFPPHTWTRTMASWSYPSTTDSSIVASSPLPTTA
jgi:catechol 2,3-dioxygenase-like lactoylglutathione lyase family enzyme